MRRARAAVRHHPGWLLAGLASGGALVGAVVAVRIATKPVPWPNRVTS